jgi:hypothetical protein
MCSRSSRAHKEAENPLSYESINVAKAVKKSISEPPISDDPKFAAVKKAIIGIPLKVKSENKKESYWLVPLLIGDKACGFAQVEKDLRMSTVGLFGASAEDRESWIEASFFERPPPEAINSIKARYSEMEMSNPFFSYDKSPAKWGWMVRLKNSREVTIFINPAGWYEQTKRDTTFEG